MHLELLRNAECWPLSSEYVSSCSFVEQGLDWCASLLFYLILVGEFSSFHIHVVSISPVGDVFWRMLNAVHLLSIANQIIKLVFVWKELCTSSNEPVEDKLIKYNRLCSLCILCIIYNLCILRNDILFAKRIQVF